MKRIILALLLALAVVPLLVFSGYAQEITASKLYLELTETGLSETDTVGVLIRVEVSDASAAVVLRDELVTRFFSGKTYTAKLHMHRTDAPCTVEDL